MRGTRPVSRSVPRVRRRERRGGRRQNDRRRVRRLCGGARSQGFRRLSQEVSSGSISLLPMGNWFFFRLKHIKSWTISWDHEVVLMESKNSLKLLYSVLVIRSLV